jgi:membrane protein DedA with SNARE-associated domain
MLSEFTDLVSAYRYWAIFPIAVFEAPVMSIVIGFFAATGYLNIYLAFGVVVLGDFVGDTVLYAVGRWCWSFFERLGLSPNLSPVKKRKVLDYFEKRDRRAIVISKLVHGVGFTGLITAGTIPVPFRRFILTCLFVTVTQSAVLTAVGMLSGQAYRSFARALGYLDIAVAVVVVVVVIVLYRKLASKIGDGETEEKE